jgi:hypothetical protein
LVLLAWCGLPDRRLVLAAEAVARTKRRSIRQKKAFT